jgi:MoaA/NifB/PqqE/SkfB family radical SAM enzyme
VSFFSLGESLRLARSLVTKDAPIYVQFYVTARCNLACEQCNVIYGNADRPEATLDEIRRIAENLAAIGTTVVLLTGGEPFMRKDLPEVCRAFVEAGIHPRIQTNGLATREMLEACVEAGVKDLSVSLDSLVPGVQELVNGDYPGSWRRALEAVSIANEVLPPEGFAAFGCVLAPRNLTGIPDVIRFATEVGWWVSLVPAHVTPPTAPHSFRTYDPRLRFPEERWPEVRRVLDEIKGLKRGGALVYDSEEYLDDIHRFVTGEPLAWRDRSGGVCDSPNLYFAVLPDGAMAVCCDLRMTERVLVQDPGFPARYLAETDHAAIREVAAGCAGCLYGSFPEITISSRFLGPLLRRAAFFSSPRRPDRPRLGVPELEARARELGGGGDALAV